MTIDFRTIVEALPRAAFILDRNSRLVYVNPLARAFAALGEGNVSGKRLEDSFPMFAGTALARTSRQDEPTARLTFEAQLASPPIWLRIAASPFGEHVLVEFEDVTESRRVQDELRFRATLLDSVGQAVIFCDAQNIVRYCNRAAGERYGWAADEVVGRHIAEVTPSGLTREEVESLLERVRHGARWSGALHVRRRNGTDVHVWLTTTAACGADGTVGVVGVSHDLTTIDEVHEALRASERRYRSLVEQASDGIIVNAIPDGRFLSVNSRFCEMLGYTHEEALRLDTAQLVHPDDVPHRQRRLEVLRAGRTVLEQRRLRHKDGHFVDVELTSRMIEGQLQSIVRDVTERNALEAQLRQAQKMESVGLLAGGVAHDFNNLLTIIVTCSAFLDARLPVNNPLRAEVREIHDAANRAAGLTRQLLAIGRRQMLQMEVLDLADLVEGVVSLLSRLVEKNIEIVTALERGAFVQVDRSQFEQVILNLAVNARDAMPGGGKLTLEVRAGADVRLVVADTGSGIPAEVRSRIFEPFFTTKDVGRGTGLGLSIVYGIVKQSGGSITCDSEVNRGTTFTVGLPGVTNVAARELTGPYSTLVHRSETVLVVEDEAALRRVLRKVLESAGYVVLDASNAQEAMCLHESHSDIDVLIADIMLPKMSGRELARELKKRMPNLRVLHMSGYDSEVTSRDDLPTATERLLMKPFTPGQLIEAVASLARGGSDFSEPPD